MTLDRSEALWSKRLQHPALKHYHMVKKPKLLAKGLTMRGTVRKQTHADLAGITKRQRRARKRMISMNYYRRKNPVIMRPPRKGWGK